MSRVAITMSGQRRAPPMGVVAQEALLGQVRLPALGVARSVGAGAVLLSNSDRDILGRLVGHTWLIQHALAEPQLSAGSGLPGWLTSWGPQCLRPLTLEGPHSLAAAWTCLLTVSSDTCFSFFQAPQRRTWSPVKCIGNRMVGSQDTGAGSRRAHLLRSRIM